MSRHGKQQNAPSLRVPLAEVSSRRANFSSVAKKVQGSYGNDCSSRRRDGSACGSCLFCRSKCATSSKFDGMSNAWDDILRDTPKHMAAARFVISYDYVTRIPTPGEVGAQFIPNVSQVIIYTAQGLTSGPFGAGSYLQIITLATPADFPTAATMPAGSFGIYLPLGSGITATTVSRKDDFLAITGVSISNVSIFNTTSFPVLADVPAHKLNMMYRRFSVSSPTGSIVNGFIPTTMKEYSTDWVVEAEFFVSSTIAPPGVPRVLRVESVIPGGYWSLVPTGLSRTIAIEEFYIRALVGAPRDDKCAPCQSSRNQGCNGTRCGKPKAHFSIGAGVTFKLANGDDSVFVNRASEVDMLKDVLENNSTKWSGFKLTQHGRVTVGSTHDNLANESRQNLARALDLEKSRAALVASERVVIPYDNFQHSMFTSRNNVCNSLARRNFLAMLSEKRNKTAQMHVAALHEANKGKHEEAVRRSEVARKAAIKRASLISAGQKNNVVAPVVSPAPVVPTVRRQVAPRPAPSVSPQQTISKPISTATLSHVNKQTAITPTETSSVLDGGLWNAAASPSDCTSPCVEVENGETDVEEIVLGEHDVETVDTASEL